MSATTTFAATERRAIPDEWRAWIAENLLAGVDAATLLARLTDHGFTARAARAAVAEAAAHPYLRGAARVVESTHGSSAQAAKYAWWLEVARRSARQASTWGQIPRVRRPSAQQLLDDYYAANRPA